MIIVPGRFTTLWWEYNVSRLHDRLKEYSFVSGSFGVYVPINLEDRNQIEFYSKLGFIEVCHGLSTDIIYLGRLF